MPSYLPNLQFPIYSGWTKFTPVIPKLYWDAYSQEQIIKELCKNFHKVEEYLDYIAELMNKWNVDFDEEMEEQFRLIWKAINDGFQEEAEKWIKANLEYIFNYTVKQVYFGLTSDGYFCAYIPDSWSDITFDTGMQYGKFDYGRLILRFNSDGSGVIDNTGRYDDNDYEEKFAELEKRVKRNEDTLYTILNEG